MGPDSGRKEPCQCCRGIPQHDEDQNKGNLDLRKNGSSVRTMFRLVQCEGKLSEGTEE